MGDYQHVLVVEDDDDLSSNVVDLLERRGYDAVAVESGAEALAFLARASQPYIVLLDLNMYDMNGWEVLSALRTSTHGEHPVIIMTGASMASVPVGTPALRKPFTESQLLGALVSAAGA